MSLKIVIFCAIVAGAVAGPTGARGTAKCVSFCKDSTKFGYAPGTTYHYDYTTDISTAVIGGSSDESRLHLTTQVDISAITNCELLLKLKNVRIEESDPADVRSRQAIEGSQTLAEELTRHPLRFSFQDGKIEHLCASEQEPNWVLNVKRGILSTLQNSMESFSQEQSTNEVDVSGRCETLYRPSGNAWGSSLTFVKTKDLTVCSQRHSHITALQSIPYTSNSATKNSPLLSGSQECTQTINNRRVETVSCTETHRFKPFDREESGARTTVSQSLVYSGESRRSPSPDDNQNIVKTGLVFQTHGPSDSVETSIANILVILKKLEHEGVPEVRSEAPAHFIELVENLRVINSAALKGLFTRIQGGVGRKYLLDAMPLVASGPSLKFMKDLLFNGELTDKQVDGWLTSLSFIKNPTLDMIEAVKPLLEETTPKNQAFLGISALINSYCKNHQSDCTEDEPIQSALTSIFSHLGSDCGISHTTDIEGLRRIIFALKAIGNAGRFPAMDESQQTQGQAQQGRLVLERCFLERSNPIEIRMAAIDAFRRMPCLSYQPTHIMSLYANKQEDTEVRIKAYLTAMKCANRALVDTVKDTLYTDSVNQVGSFVWTHLTNLQETSSPDKQAIRDLLSNDFLRNKFNTDARKYSRNYEGSLYREDWNAGVSSDANVIFTPDSFLPRSAMLNLTVHLFGESMNVLEVGGRVKALEQLLEPIFGPNGYFPDETVTEALHSIKRSKREAKSNDIERLSNIYNQASLNGPSTSPMGSVYTRIFGHEIMYKNFELLNEQHEPSLVDENGNDWMDMSGILNALIQGQDIQYTKSTVLLDATYTITTAAGIPLSLGLQSAATVGLVANGKLDMAKFWETKELDVQGLLRPSAAIQVDGVFSVQLGATSSSAKIKSGLKLQNTLHTSTAMQGALRMKGAKLVHASIALPQDKQEIFKASSSLLLIRASGENQVLVSEREIQTPTKYCFPSSSISNVLGVEMCGEMSDELTFPPTNPAFVALYLQKTDTFQSYEFDYHFENEQQQTVVSVIFDTPGSRVNRRLAANFHLDPVSGKLEASLNTPSTALAVDGKYSEQTKALQLTVSAQREEVLLVKLGLNQQLDGSRMEPQLLVKFYNRPLVALEGSLDLLNMKETNGKASLNLVLSHVTPNPIRVHGEVVKANDKYDTKVGIESELVTGGARSQFRLTSSMVSVKSAVEYSWKSRSTKNVEISAKVVSSKKGTLGQFRTQLSFAMADSPDTNLDFTWDTKKSIGYLENSMIARFGKSSWEGQTLYNNQMSKDAQELTIKAILSAPRQEIDYNVELTHKLNAAGMTTKFQGRTNARNEVKAEIVFADENAATPSNEDNANDLLKKTLAAKVNWPGKEYSLRSHLRETRDGEFDLELLLLPHARPEMKATVTYKNKSTSKRLEHSVEFRARGFIADPITGSGAFTASDKQSSFTAQLAIEGNQAYSGKWSTGLDYTVTRNLKTLKGKLTLNERNYNGEVNLRKTKLGDRVLNIDLKAARHVAIEATLRGDLPGPLTVSFTFYPDKDQSPDSKVRLQGNVDPRRSLNFQLNYFGQELSGSLLHENTKWEVEGTWEGEKWAIVVDTPHLTAHKLAITAKLETPIDGFKDMSLSAEHTCNGKELTAQVRGALEKYQVSFNLAGAMTKVEVSLRTDLDVTGMKPLEGVLRIAHGGQEKSLELTGKRGGKEKSIKASLNYVTRGFNADFEFTGCGMIPAIKAEITHDHQTEFNTRAGIEWTPATKSRSAAQRIQLELTGTTRPIALKFTLTSPWAKFEKLEGQMSLVNEAEHRAFELSFNGDFPVFPISFTSRLIGSSPNFNVLTSVSWTNDKRRIQSIEISSEGRFDALLSSALTVNLLVPKHSYQLVWGAQKGSRSTERSQIQLGATLDGKRYASDLTWTLPSTQQIQASVSGQWEDQPIHSLEFEHLRKDGEFKIQLKVVKGQKSLVTLSTDLKSSGLARWDFTTILESDHHIDFLPKIEISSVHRMERDGQIQHKSEILIKDSPLKLWKEEEIRTTLAFNFQAGKQFDAVLSLNEENVRVEGELETSRVGKKVQFQISSSRFSPVEIQGEYRHGGSDGYHATISAAMNGNKLVTVKAGAGQKDKNLEGNLEIDCSFGHHLTATAVLNMKQNSLKIMLKEDHANWIDLVFSAQAKPTQGSVKVEIQSELFEFLQNKVQLEAAYEMDALLDFSAKYVNDGQVKSVEGKGVWTEEKKGLEMSLRGDDSGSFYIRMEGFSEIQSSLTINKARIFHVSAVHEMDQSGEYALGKHTLKLSAQTQTIRQPYEIRTTLGLDWSKLLFQLSTPLEGWTDLSLTGQFEIESSKPVKSIQLVAMKEQERYVLNAQVRLPSSADATTKILVTVQTPIRGWSSMNFDLELSTKEQYGGNLEVALDSWKFVVKGYVSPKNVNVALETPFETLRRLSLQGQWSVMGKKKDVSLEASLNQHAYAVEGTWEMEKTHGTAAISLAGKEKSINYDLELSYDLRKDYEAHAQVKTGESSETYKIGGRVGLSKTGFTLKAVTPFPGFETISGEAMYDPRSQSGNEHAVNIKMDLNGERVVKLQLVVRLQSGQIQAQGTWSLPALGFRDDSGLEVTINYQPQGEQKLFSIQGSFDQRNNFQASLALNHAGKLYSLNKAAAASLILDISLPTENLKKLNLDVKYERKIGSESAHEHSLTLSATKDEDTLQGGLNAQYQFSSKNFGLQLEGDFAAPSLGIRRMEAAGRVQAQVNQEGVSSLLLEGDLNGRKHKIEGSLQFNSHSADLQVNTSFEILSQLQLAGNLHSNGQYEATVRVNGQEARLKGRYVFNGLKLSQITLDLVTPIEGFETIKSNAEIKIHSGSLLAALTFQNQKVRYGAQLEGTYADKAADLKLTLNTPVRKFESVIATLAFSTQQLQLVLTRNQKEEIRGELTLAHGELQANLVTDLPIRHNINSRNTITWTLAPFSVNVALELGHSDYSASLRTNIGSGLRSGLISFRTSLLQGVLEEIQVDWQLEGGLESGRAVGTFALDSTRKSFKSSWKNNEGEWDSAKFEIWFSPSGDSNNNENDYDDDSNDESTANDSGFSAQYSLANAGNGKLAASVVYNWQGRRQTFTFSTALKRGSSASTLDISLQTPFRLFREASVTAKLISNSESSGHNFDLVANLNDETLLNTNALLSLSTLASKLKWTFDAPAICAPFTLSAGYDVLQEQKYMEVSFGQNQYQMNVRADAVVPSDKENSNEIELRMTVNSNVPLIEVSASGSLKAGYKIDRDDTRHLTVSVNSETTGKWEVNGALRLHPADFLAKLRVNSPDPDIIPSMRYELDFIGNTRQGISSRLSLQMDKYPEIGASLTVSMDKILLTFNSGISGFENMSVEGKLESGSGFAHKTFSLDVNAMGGKLTLEGNLNIPSKNSMAARGNLRLTSTWEKLTTSGKLSLNVGEDGVVVVSGQWGDQNVALRGQINTNSGSGKRHGRGGRSSGPWWAAANTEFALEANSEEKFRIKTSHVVGNNQYSFNISLGEQYSLQSFVQTDKDKVLSSTVQWGQDQLVRLLAEAGSGRFVASVETPWTSDIQANGEYTVIPGEELSAKGHFTYDGERSSLEALAQTAKGSFKSSINVDIPALRQNLNAEMNVQKVRDGTFDGEIDLRMGERHLAVRGQAVEVEKDLNGRRVVERKLKLHLNLPSKSFSDMSTEFTILRSKSGFSTLQVETSLTLPRLGVSKAAFGYEIPMDNAKHVGIRAMIDSPLIPTNGPVEFKISTEIIAARNFRVRVQYENNDIQLAWDTTLPTLKIEALANIPALFPKHSPFVFLIDGSVDLVEAKSVRLDASGSCSKYSFAVQSTFGMVGDTIESRLTLNVPALLEGPWEISANLELGSSGRYLLNLEGSRGGRRNSDSIGFVGEVTVREGHLAASGKVTGVLGSHAISAEAKKVDQSSWELTLNGESPDLLSGKKFNVQGKFKNVNKNGIEIEMECRTRRSVHSGRIVLVLDPKEGRISANLQSPSWQQPLSLTVSWTLDTKTMALQGRILAVVMGERHSLEGAFNLQDLAGQINMQSPFIPGQEFNVQTKIVTRSDNVQLLADAKFNGKQWRLETTGKYNNAQDLEAKLEIRTPFKDFDRITLGGKLNSNEISAEIYTPFKDFPNAMFSLSGVPLFEPFSFRNIQPTILVGLPWVTYRGSVIFTLPQKGTPGQFQVAYGQSNPKQRRQSLGQVFEATLEIPSLDDLNLQMSSPVKVRFEATIPSASGRPQKKIQWEVSGRLQWKTWAELNAVAQVNDQKLELVSSVINDSGNRRLSLELTTPFTDFERFAASIRLEKYQDSHSILFEFQPPTWDAPKRVEVDFKYEFKGLMDMGAEVTVSSPALLETPLSFTVQSKVMSQGIYKGRIEGVFGQKRPTLSIDAGIADDHIYATLLAVLHPAESSYQSKIHFEVNRQGKTEGQDFSGKFLIEYEQNPLFQAELSFANPEDLLDTKFLVKTPFAILRSVNGGLRMSPLNWNKDRLSLQKILTNLDMSLGLAYNDKRVMQLELVNLEGKKSLEIHNPIRPIALSLTYERVAGRKLRVLAEFCWDTRRTEHSTIGLDLLLSRPTPTSAARIGSIKISAGGMGSYHAILSHLLTATKFDQSLRFRCQPPMGSLVYEMGYSVNLMDLSTTGNKKYQFSSTLELPSRAIQLNVSLLDSEKRASQVVELKWDAGRDASKKIGYKFNTMRSNVWKNRQVKREVSLIHPSLASDFTLQFETSFKNEGLNAAIVALKFTPVDHLTLTFSRPEQQQQEQQGDFILSLVHPATNFNVQLLGRQRQGDNPGSLTLSYVDIHGDNLILQAAYLLDAATKSGLVELSAGRGSSQLTSLFRVQLVNERSQTVLNVRGMDMQMDLKVHKDRTYFDLAVETEEGKRVFLTAGLPHKKEVSFKLWREEYGMNIQDVLVALRLNTSHILSTKVTWRPEISQEMQSLLTVTLPRSVGASVGSGWSALSRKIGEEANGRWEMLNPGVKQTLEKIAVFTQEEVTKIYEEVSRFAQLLKDLYEDNFLFSKDIAQILARSLEGVLGLCADTCSFVSNIFGDLLNILKDSLLQVIRVVKESTGQLEKRVISIWNAVEDWIERIWREYFKILADISDMIEDAYDTAMEIVEGKLDQVERKLLGVGFIRKAVLLYQDYATWVEELPLQDFIDKARVYFDELIWQPMRVYYMPYYEALEVAIEEKNLLAFLELPPFPYLRHVSARFNALTTRLLSFIEAEQKIKLLVTKVLQALDGIVRRNIPTSHVIWDVQKGNIEYHQPLTLVQWEDFESLPTLIRNKEDAEDVNKMSDFYYQILDTMSNVKPALDMNIRDILPPFGAHAVMAGDYHYYTFDKQYFRFAGECSYVLAADLLHKNFSLIVNYENRDGGVRKRSYSLISGENSVDIDAANLKVTLDGRKVELPLEVGPTFIRRMPNALEIFDKRGFQMTCSQSPAVCTVSVSGWYFGKVQGLLGSYDNEQMNDMRTPEGQIVEDVARFAHSWRVGRGSGECRMKNWARNDNGQPQQPLQDVDNVCSQYFDNRNSLLRPCFSRVETSKFKEMCMYDTARNMNKASRQESACTAINAYVTECQKNDVDVWLPPVCVVCKLEDGTTLLSGENATLEVNGEVKPPMSSDVVILLEESSCVSTAGLTDMIKKLDNTLRTQGGLSENRYTLIGYGGRGPHRNPHIRTSSGQIWAHSTLFRISEGIEMNGEGHGDLYGALEFAASTLKFRAGVSKTLIAITCGDERCGSESRYPDTLTLLLENDMKLHMLTPKDLSYRGSKKDAGNSKIFGIDRHGVYTSAHTRDLSLEADRSLKRQINLPKDLCTPLAVETNGTRFTLQRSAKKFIDVWTRRVALTAQPSQCQHCECIPDKFGMATTVCNQCVSPNLQKQLLEWEKYQSIEEVQDDSEFDIQAYE